MKKANPPRQFRKVTFLWNLAMEGVDFYFQAAVIHWKLASSLTVSGWFSSTRFVWRNLGQHRHRRQQKSTACLSSDEKCCLLSKQNWWNYGGDHQGLAAWWLWMLWAWMQVCSSCTRTWIPQVHFWQNLRGPPKKHKKKTDKLDQHVRTLEGGWCRCVWLTLVVQVHDLLTSSTTMFWSRKVTECGVKISVMIGLLLVLEYSWCSHIQCGVHRHPPLIEMLQVVEIFICSPTKHICRR